MRTRNQSHAHRHMKRKKDTDTVAHYCRSYIFLSMVYRLFVVLLCLRLLIFFLFLLHLFSRSIFSLSFYSSSLSSSFSSSFSHFSVFILCKIYIYIYTFKKKSLPFLRKSNIYTRVCWVTAVKTDFRKYDRGNRCAKKYFETGGCSFVLDAHPLFPRSFDAHSFSFFGTIRGKLSHPNPRAAWSQEPLFVPLNVYVFADVCRYYYSILPRISCTYRSLCAHRNVYLFTFFRERDLKREGKKRSISLSLSLSYPSWSWFESNLAMDLTWTRTFENSSYREKR